MDHLNLRRAECLLDFAVYFSAEIGPKWPKQYELDTLSYELNALEKMFKKNMVQ